MSDLQAAAQQALEALEHGQHTLKQVSENQWESRGDLAMQALHAALAEPDTKVASQDKAKSSAEPEQEPQCNPHPRAPHGFMRTASHTENRYVCECEGWEPYEAGYQAGMEAALAEPVPDSKHATIAEWWADKQRKPPATIDEIFDRMNKAPKGVFYGHDPMTIWMEAWRAAEQHGIKDA